MDNQQLEVIEGAMLVLSAMPGMEKYLMAAVRCAHLASFRLHFVEGGVFRQLCLRRSTRMRWGSTVRWALKVSFDPTRHGSAWLWYHLFYSRRYQNN
jgi:hypothetical protein